MSRSSKPSAQEFAQVRARVRTVLLEHGTALLPGSPTPETIDDIISDIVKRHVPTLHGETKALEARVGAGAGRELEIEVSNHGGAIMAAYEDAGYYTGIAMGLEMAALTVGGALSRVGTKGGRR